MALSLGGCGEAREVLCVSSSGPRTVDDSQKGDLANMKPFIGITRFLRPTFAARIAGVSFVALKSLSASARCLSTLDNSRPLVELDSLDTPDSPQHTSVPEDAKACEEKGAKRGRWTLDERRKLRDASAAGMTIKAIEPLFPTRSHAAIEKQRHTLRTSDDQDKEDKPAVVWSPAETQLLKKLHAEGASMYKLRAHFPTRTNKSLEGAISRWITQASVNSCKGGAAWTSEDLFRLTELAAQGAFRREIVEALGRTCNSVSVKASCLGIKLSSSRKRFTAEEVELIVQMRGDGASFRSIYIALGRVHGEGSITQTYYRHRPPEDRAAKLQRIFRIAQLSLDDLKIIDALRVQGATWSDIERRYPEHEPGLIHESYKRFVNGKLSATDLRKVESLLGEGHTWQNIAGGNDYKHFSAEGIRSAYLRALEKQQSARPAEPGC